MSKPKEPMKKKMLEYLDWLRSVAFEHLWMPTYTQEKIDKTIRACIKQGRPKVSKAQIENICLILLACDWPEQISTLKEWLKTRGVEIKGEEDDDERINSL